MLHRASGSKTQRFIVLATDGLWDVFTNEEVIQFIEDHWDEEGHGAKAAAREAFNRYVSWKYPFLVQLHSGFLVWSVHWRGTYLVLSRTGSFNVYVPWNDLYLVLLCSGFLDSMCLKIVDCLERRLCSTRIYIHEQGVIDSMCVLVFDPLDGQSLLRSHIVS